MKILEQINKPDVLKSLSIKELNDLAAEIREFLIDSVSKTGGHLASNLGVVELTLALHKSFDSPKDKIIWDVGHQTYVHKILTGRKDKFNTLRRLGGLSGFPKSEESCHDIFNTGHSSTSISAALGMARGRDLSGEDYSVIAVIGDGALTGGMAFEALNDAGRCKNDLIVILNDNEMSISKNVGSISSYLNKIRIYPSYFRFKHFIERSILKIPKYGDFFKKILLKFKDSIKHLLVAGQLFEELGFIYVGPIDGHDIKKLCEVFESIKSLEGPILLHIYTKKGKGYSFAENEPAIFHGIGRFEVDTGEAFGSGKDDYSKVMGDKLCSLSERNNKIVAITAAMPISTGLYKFAEKFPDRFFDAGIAEQHAVTCAAGMSKCGYIPIVAIYSSFMQRAYDQIIHDVALQNLHVVLMVDRAGIVGEDGETHQGIFDISFLSSIPNMSLLAPADFEELRDMMDYAISTHRAPIAIRYPKGEQDMAFSHNVFEFGKGEILREGRDITIAAAGRMVYYAFVAAQELEKQGVTAEVINLRTIKPFDEELIIKSVQKTKKLITVEDNITIGGVGSGIGQMLFERGLKDISFKIMGFPDEVITQGTCTQLFELFGLSSNGIVNVALKELKK